MKKSYFAEGIGTFLLVFVGCSSLRLIDIGWLSFSLAPHLAFGGILVITIAILANTSGAHFNPAVSLAFYLQKNINLKTLIFYILFQCAGALLACLAMLWLFPNSSQFGATLPTVTLAQGLLLEILLTIILISVIFSVALVFQLKPLLSAIAIGSTVALCSYFAGPLTGASMNPARSLGPNLFQGQAHLLWLYILAPTLAAILTSLIFNKLQGRVQQ